MYDIRTGESFGVNNIISKAYINILVYPCILEPWQFNLSNPET